MALNGTNGATDTIEATVALESRQRLDSVQRDDIPRDSVFHFMFPAMWGEYGRNLAALPESLPPYNRTAFWQSRDIALLSTPKYEAMWAVTVGVAVTKAAAWGWEIESSVPLRQKRAHQILLNSTAGVFTGWVHFLSAHLRSFMLTGKAVVEIERETKAYGSRIRALHHLDPLRCRFTDDPMIPIEYMDRKGRVHELKYWQVMLFADNLDPTEGEYALVESAAERAYGRIKLMAAISQFLYEKVSGKRVLSIEFLPGLSAKQLENALTNADENRAQKGNMIYMGAMLVPLPTDSPVQRVSIPLAEIPNGFDPQNLRDDSTVIYAGATGQDINDIDPRLAARQALGSGAQSIVLAEKARGKGLAAWRQQWLHSMNTLVLNDAITTFAWAEQNLEDSQRQADIADKQVNTVKTMIEAQLVTPDQGRNLLVDYEVLPSEFLEEDVTGGGKLADDDKAKVDDPDTQGETADDTPADEQEQEQEENPVMESDSQKERRKRPLDVARLLLEERDWAKRLATELI